MTTRRDAPSAAETTRRRLFVYNSGFFTQKRLRRILTLSGYRVTTGWPGPDDLVGVWGQSPTAHRGEAIAARSGVGLVRIEDAWLRSLHPGRAKEPPLGLLIDHSGVHYDPSQISDLERLLSTHPLDDTALLDQARGLITRIKEAHLTKFSAVDPSVPTPPPGYVLVLDQSRGDASVTASGADRNRFLEMLFVAQEENPGARIILKTHPEAAAGFRAGYFTEDDLSDHVTCLTEPVSPWTLFEGAVAVYTVSSQLGFEAIFAGHKPRVFGQPFYAGWGLTQDEFPLHRRQRRLSRAQLFAAAMLLYPTWYDPHRDQLCDLATAVEALAAEARVWREDHRGWAASGMRLWKRPHLQRFFGRHRPIQFWNAPPGDTRRQMVWASAALGTPDTAARVEDGFLRSRGLGAALVPPLSLVLDDQGIYYDPTRPSRLEALIAARATLRPDQEARARALIRAITQGALSKYNLGGAASTLPDGQRILVVGQVEDDASITTGTSAIRTNIDLLKAARAAHPSAQLIYKPHPDVEAGLRPGACDTTGLADHVAVRADVVTLLEQVQEVWTMTSLLGFEAVLRRVPVTTLGAPFYAGWGLTTDLGDVPPRRRARPSLPGLVHATLIDYPRYLDPKTGLPCPVEVVVARLATGDLPTPGPGNRMLSKLQGLLASRAAFWR
ncbi:capsular polysaccharide biosynthesis protein [Roseobacter cerasinus]|uniref:Capsular polysaccharide biosynthesis protein n=1 Tax=Roseobacter cerasinus TaxID=2602289 RepID=A0A640VXD3_9RHOB|nr:capsular polysaccharide biosynthesis protein [Roseobacter cerasinus]GFE52020.1 capsular polysaccharide biosynthesis protein [Roseobacter cerasinus]